MSSHPIRDRARRALLLGCVSGATISALALAQASAASADVTSVYPPEAQSREFTGGDGAWTSTKEQEGPLGGALCVEGVTCPLVTDEYQSVGGVGGAADGFLETSEEGGLAGVGLLAKSSGIYESPAFTYEGAAGQTPTAVELTLAREADLTTLLELTGASATSTVELADQTSPSASVVAVDADNVTGSGWETVTSSVPPSALAVGDTYKVRVTTTFTTPAAVVPAGGVGYDDVSLTATKAEAAAGGNGEDGAGGGTGGQGASGTSGAGTGTGGDGSDGSGAKTGGPGSSNGVSAAQLQSMLSSSGLVGPAMLKGGRLSVRAKCPAKAGGTCTLSLQGMLSRHKVATVGRKAKVKKGKTKSFALTVKPAARTKVASKKKILFKETVKVGKAKATMWKSLKLVRK